MVYTMSIKKMMMVLILAYAAATILGPIVIGILKREKASQTEREAGPESHKKKGGTPVMGGFIFLIPFIVFSLIFSDDLAQVLPVAVLTAGCASIGFIDDFIKVVLKRNLGLRAWQKIILQCVVTALFAWLLIRVAGASYAKSQPFDPFEMIIPFSGGQTTDLGILKYPALLFITLATVNGTNLTDGVDGLSASVTAVVAGFFAFVAAFVVAGAGSVAVLPVAFLGGLLGYLFYNVYPGRVMMGDTGSLALGGFVVGMSYMLKLPLFIPLFGIIYAAEVVSVVLQVSYFKLTHGKRLFRMSPLHHHFELGGWSETRVVNVFTTVTIIGCAVALIGL